MVLLQRDELELEGALQCKFQKGGILTRLMTARDPVTQYASVTADHFGHDSSQYYHGSQNIQRKPNHLCLAQVRQEVAL